MTEVALSVCRFFDVQGQQAEPVIGATGKSACHTPDSPSAIAPAYVNSGIAAAAVPSAVTTRLPLATLDVAGQSLAVGAAGRSLAVAPTPTACTQSISISGSADTEDLSSADLRAAADACLPRLPGPAVAVGSDSCSGSSRAVAALEGVMSIPGQTFQLPDITRTADILIVAVG